MKKIKLKKSVIYIGVIIMSIITLLGTIGFIRPKITLIGKETISININQKYEELGATAIYFNKDITNELVITGKVDESKVGTYKIKYTLKKYGLTFRKTRSVKVIDNIYPTIVLQGDEEITLCPKTNFKELGYKAQDNYDGDITKKVKTKQKNNLVIYNVKDTSGNETEITRKLKFSDTVKPKIKLKGSKNVYIKVNSKYKEAGYDIEDNCDSDLIKKIKVTSNIDITKEGKYKVNYTVEDESGNKASTFRNIYVIKENKDVKSSKDTTNNNGIIYLTFDDGPSKSITPKILDILKKKNIKATFFVINQSDSLNYLIKRASDEGHTIGLHSYSHNYEKIYSSTNKYFNDLDKISNKVYSITGKFSNIIRFPGGTSNTISRKYSTGIMTNLSKMVTEQGYKYYDWNVGSGDSGGAKTKEDVYRNVVKNLKINRANIVLMHDFENNYKTLNALSDIIDYGIQKGYEFKAITASTPRVAHKPNN